MAFAHLSERDEERIAEVLDEFDGHQHRWERAIGQAHYRAQRWTTWLPPKRMHKAPYKPMGPTPDELRARVARNKARAEKLAAVQAARQDRERRVAAMAAQKAYTEARVAAWTERVEATRVRRKGAGNFADPAKIARARELREQGYSLREIVRETGLSKCTVNAHVKPRDRAEALRLKHQRWKAEGRPVVPPWQRKRAA